MAREAARISSASSSSCSAVGMARNHTATGPRDDTGRGYNAGTMPARTPKLRPVDGDAPDTDAQPEGAVTEERMRLTADRILVRVPDESERKSKAGLLIPATAATPVKRCVWSDVVLVGPETRNV